MINHCCFIDGRSDIAADPYRIEAAGLGRLVPSWHRRSHLAIQSVNTNIKFAKQMI